MDKRVANTRTVLQTEMTECGAACLSMILQYYGQYAPLEELRLETDVSRDGCSAGNLVKAARNRGLETEGYEMDTEELMMAEPPCVIWWEGDHFVVFEGCRGDRFLINDPAFGKREVARSDMERDFSGVVLTFAPTESFREHSSYGKKAPTFISSGKMTGAMGAFPSRAALTMVAGAGSAALVSLGARMLSGLSSSAAGTSAAGTPTAGAVITAAVPMLLGILLIGIFAAQMTLWRERSELSGSWPFLRKLLFAPIAFLEDRYPEDLLRSVVKSDRICRSAVELPALMVTCLAWIAFPLCLLASRHPEAALPLLLAMAIAAAIYLIGKRAGVREYAKARVLDGNMARVLFTDIEKREIIRGMGRAEEYATRITNAHRAAEEVHRSIREKTYREFLLKGIVYVTAFAASLYIIRETTETPSAFISWILSGLAMIAGWEGLILLIGGIGDLNEDLETTGIMAEEGSCETDENDKADERANPIEGYEKLKGNIEARSIAFGYGSFGEYLFEDLDLDVSGGSTVVITGGTGCGKSTLGKILAGLMSPSEGSVLYDGRKLEEIPMRQIYASIATVKQKSTLFPASVRENITMWNPAVREDAVIRAARDACAEEFIGRLPEGYDTLIGRGGRGLSGGEQQRIELARALATDPSILILDEAFSAIDDETTLRMIENIKRRGCTCIIITRDRVLIGEGTKIIDLDEGQERA